MSDPPVSASAPSPSFSCLPLVSENVCHAHKLIKPYIRRTPLLTCQTLTDMASTRRQAGAANPKLNLYFKCENFQKTGAFKVRGAYHAVVRLTEKFGIEEVRRRGVITHSSGNHAQALSLAASTFQIPAYIVMPSISTPSKIAATQALTPHVIFSGSTGEEREGKVQEVMKQSGAILIPPYDHGDIVLGQGTVALEAEEQFGGREDGQVCTVHGISLSGENDSDVDTIGPKGENTRGRPKRPMRQLDAILVPCGGGGLLSGVATYFSDKDDESGGAHPLHHASVDVPSSSATSASIMPSNSISSRQQPISPPVPSASSSSSSSPQQQGGFTRYQDAACASPPTEEPKRPAGRKRPLVFGAEPDYQGADDARRSLATGTRISSVKSLTIADGLRTPLGRINWSVISDPRKVTAIYSVSEAQIKGAMKLLLERAKWLVEPSGAVPLAVALYNEEFRAYVEAEQEKEMAEAGVARPWDVGVVISGGNTTVGAIAGMFGSGQGEGIDQVKDDDDDDDDDDEKAIERQEGKITMDGVRLAENVAG